MKSIKYIALSALLALGFVSCSEKPVEYKPAEAVGNSEVYFPTGQAKYFNLKEVNAIEVTISRADKEGAISVPVTMTASNPAFTAPSSVSFAAGQASTTLTVSVDMSQVKEAVEETVTLKISDQVTPYGDDTFTFTASLPVSWNLLGKGTFTMDWWGEERVVNLYYQDLDEFPGMRYCYVDKGWGPDAGDNNYYFYWDTKTNACYVPMQYSGYTTSAGKECWYSDAASFYNAYNAWGMECPSTEYFEWANNWDIAKGFNAPHYDGNGGFYLGDWFYIVDGGVPTGSGWQFGGNQDVFVLDGFVRTVDYNDENHFGAAKALWDGTVSSMVFSNDGVEPLDFESTLYYDAEYELDEETTEMEITYYLKDYFAEGYNLAFTSQAPELLEEGTAITDVENAQFTGIHIFGYPVYANVKKGSVSCPADSDFPVFSIVLSVYTQDEEGNKVHDFGTLTDVFTAEAEAKTGYTITDIYGGYFEDYLGVWDCFSFDLSDGKLYEYNILIEDAKATTAEGNPLVTIKNLSGLANYFNDTVYAQYYDYCIEVAPQDINGQYQGQDLSLKTVDVAAGKVYSVEQAYVLGGICKDGALAFVTPYSNINLNGFGWYAGTSALAYVYDVYAFGPATSSMAKQPLSKKYNANQLYIDGLKAESSLNAGSMTLRRPGTKAVQASTKRTLHLTPVVRTKNFEVISL
ncbi:MAG: hypothetical protein MJZ09_07275 [Bacteroidales bacterium]|nr:hypothetical protein [Bacteroidales bacterium]